MLGDRAAAEDVAAEAAIRVTLGGKPARLLPLITYGLAVDEYRRRGYEIPSGLITDEDGDFTSRAAEFALPAAATYETVEFQDEFDAAVRGLEESERDAYILTELRGLSQREAADVLGTSQPTVHRRAEAARHFIKGAIA